MIRIQKLDKYYNRQKQNELHVLDDLTYEFPERGMCAIFGPSGCGKTTLLNVIGGLDDPTSGAVRYDETELSEDENRIRNRDIGFIFQNYNLNKDETVFDNVADSLRLCGIEDEAVIEERVMAALQNVGMGKFRKRLPDTLSGGQQQRVAIARAIVKNPKVLLADEPTGNLDEANTILVMDILKKMSEEHLVILVTHETKLVDFYCDTVVDLSDGKIVGVRSNENTNGYVGRNRNDIYLGELEQSTCGDSNTTVRYYGEPLESPLQLTIVHHNGRVFLRVDEGKVTVLEPGSEVKLKEGVFTDRSAGDTSETGIDMSKLPPVEGERYGRLFRLKDSIKQGFRANFRNSVGKKKRNALIACLFFFGVALVFFTAWFGQDLRSVFSIREEINEQTFLVCASDQDIAERIKSMAADPSAAVDYYDITVIFDNNINTYGIELYFDYATFETFGYYSDGFEFPQSEMIGTQQYPVTIAGDGELLCGSRELKNDDVLITTQVADRILKTTPYEYIREYRDLIGLKMYAIIGGGQFFRIAGVIRSDENSIFSSVDKTKNDLDVYRGIVCDTDDYFNLAPGECAMICLYESRRKPSFPDYEEGETMVFNGLQLTLTKKIDLTLLETASAYKKTDEEQPDPEEIERLQNKKNEFEEHFTIKNFFSTNAGRVFVLNKSDYEATENMIGTTSKWMLGVEGSSKDETAMYVSSYDDAVAYYRIHSKDPKATTEYLRAHFSDVTNRRRFEPSEISSGVITPDDRFNMVFENSKRNVLGQLALVAVFLVFLGICMYLVMRASVMNRTREIGIYRAIGAKKSNIVFRFAVETVVVLMLSAVIGFLIISIAITYITSRSAFSGVDSFYYPLWMAVALFVFLMTVGTVCGIVPVILLLRKTPSEILAKYDI
ncbi:MAG: ABC transporter ATP-binding protein/permease [Lachnospiraceae bacterium]|nr:ABC transporter ATP-binding protein/permease [Lachnospiraceae bacterium]